MATITSTRRTYKNKNVTTDSYCVRVVLTNGTTYRYTTCNKDLTMTQYVNSSGATLSLPAAVTYLSTQGINLSAVGFSETSPGEIDIESTFFNSSIERDLILSGSFNNARIYIFLTSWEAPIEDDEKVFGGLWGETTITDDRFTVKLTSLLDVLNLESMRVYSSRCPVSLGSDKCGVIMSPATWTANTTYEVLNNYDARNSKVVTPVTPNGRWYIATDGGLSGASQPSWNTTIGGTTIDNTVIWTTILPNVLTNTTTAYTSSTKYLTVGTALLAGMSTHLANGYLEFLNGDRQGQKYRIKSADLAGVYLHLPIYGSYSGTYNIQLTSGCNKSLLDDCVARYRNNYNFQAFPYIPGKAAVAYIAGTK
jgi:hypothetical protein